MSYISAIRTGDEVLVWERTPCSEKRELQAYPAPYYFYVRDEDGEFTSLYGDRLTRYDFHTASEFQSARAHNQASDIEMFESDIPPELKILSEHYYGIPAPNLHVSFFDIEVDYDPSIGFADVANPYAPINSVSIYHTYSNRFVVLTVPPNLASYNETQDTYETGPAPKEFYQQLNEIAALPDDIEIDIQFCSSETDLLMRLLVEIDNSDVICGWNSDFFDVPYVGKRLQRLGKRFLDMLSFTGARAPKFREVEVMGNISQTLDLSGRISADYMVLFRKYEMAERPSYKLESIADEMLPNLTKLEYEGSLASLYRTNFPYFIRYNIRDTEILRGLEDTLGYVELANRMMHMSTGVWKHVAGTLKLVEYALVNYCHYEFGNLIVNDFHEADTSGSIQGAIVLIPQVGLHELTGSIDLRSLYPTTIRSINISPETLLAQFILDDEYDVTEEIANGTFRRLTLEFDDRTHVPREYRGKTITQSAEEWRDFLIIHNWAISGYGTVFSQEKQGIVPKVLEDWYNMRKQYQKLKAEAKQAGDTAKATYYDKLQYVYKIKLNSAYGALTNAFFRFYDLRMGESTTGTGRRVLLHQCAKTAEILDGEYCYPTPADENEDETQKYSIGGIRYWQTHRGYKPGSSVVYGDTDSTYFETGADNVEDAIVVADSVAHLVNQSYQQFMQKSFLCTPGYDNIMGCSREIVSDRGIFVDKKRYILHVVNSDGVPVDDLKVMGLDTKKTTLPKPIANKLNDFIRRYLKGEEWDVIAHEIVDFKDHLETTDDVMSIGLPKGIRGVEAYTRKLKVDPSTRLPGHVAAAICYNLCLKKYNDHQSIPIMSGMKIKVFYITKKIDRFKSIAIPVDIEQVPQWFLDEFKIDRAAHTQRLVDKPLQNIIKAIDKNVPTRQSLFVDELLEF